MLRRVVVTCAVRTHRRLLFGTVELTGQKRAVDHSELRVGHAMASGTAQFPVTPPKCHVWLSVHPVCRGHGTPLSRPPNQNLHRCQVEPDRGLMDIGAPVVP